MEVNSSVLRGLGKRSGFGVRADILKPRPQMRAGHAHTAWGFTDNAGVNCECALRKERVRMPCGRVRGVLGSRAWG